MMAVQLIIAEVLFVVEAVVTVVVAGEDRGGALLRG
jgi:hypothetical protein